MQGPKHSYQKESQVRDFSISPTNLAEGPIKKSIFISQDSAAATCLRLRLDSSTSSPLAATLPYGCQPSTTSIEESSETLNPRNTTTSGDLKKPSLSTYLIGSVDPGGPKARKY
jgi:hypothetical protein